MGRVGVPVRDAPRPVLARDRQLRLDALVVLAADRRSAIGQSAPTPSRVKVSKSDGWKRGDVAGEVDHRAADAVAGVVLAELDRIVAADHPIRGPVQLVRPRLIGDPVAVGIPERPGLEHDDLPAPSRQALRERAAARARPRRWPGRPRRPRRSGAMRSRFCSPRSCGCSRNRESLSMAGRRSFIRTARRRRAPDRDRTLGRAPSGSGSAGAVRMYPRGYRGPP